jgi:DNA-binding protein H-NS
LADPFLFVLKAASENFEGTIMPRLSSKMQIRSLTLSVRDVMRECEKTIRLIRRLEKRAVAAAQSTGRSAGRRRKLGPVAIKYRDNEGNTWTGRGRTARWIVEAEKAGKKRERFLVRGRKNR